MHNALLENFVLSAVGFEEGTTLAKSRLERVMPEIWVTCEEAPKIFQDLRRTKLAQGSCSIYE